ncbi:rev1 DNA directed polymerase [Nomia melanderi]|uniref:rev1 DNA directed polymerase n=1 Tax=Nomia melanderi TaxID=2448451 RepID=UPI003FCCB619
MSKKKKTEAWGDNGFEDWGGYMAAKQAKLEEQFRAEADKEFQNASNIFEGIAIFVNGYTDPSSDELRRLMMAHGGVYHHYMRPRATTHIIASNLPHSKIILYRKSQNPIPICKPNWIVDSIKAGRVLNFQNYLLYSNCTDTQPRLNYKKKTEASELNDHPDAHNEIERNNDLKPLSNDNTVSTLKNTAINQDVPNPSASHSKRDARSTKNSEFISEFYNNSRLHHISTMGATFKNYVNELRDKSNGKFPGLTKLKESRDMKLGGSLSCSQSNSQNDMLDLQEENKIYISQGSVIMHIDMDCFFVSVGLRNKPELRGLPVAVAHAKGNRQLASTSKDVSNDELGSMSEIASCSYEARKAGVYNGMFLGEALKICPNLKTIPYDFEGYKEVSYTLYDTVASYTLDIEAVSCDEMYADCTKILEECCVTPMEFASAIRQEIKGKTGCPVSTGFGSNKLLARLATRKAKPDGQFHLKQNIETCIGGLNVQDLPGVGWTTTNKLKTMNVRTCAELQTITSSALQKEFGKKTGEVLYNMCRGVDNSKLNLEHIRKSVSAEVNYGIRFESNEEAVDFLKKLSVEVADRLRKANARGRSITLKLLIRAKEAPKETAKFMGHGLCDYMTKSKNLIAPIDDADIIAKEVIGLWNQMLKAPEDARGIGIQITRLEILKSKSRDMTLRNFVNKAKDNSALTKSTETCRNNEARTESVHSVPSTSKDVIVNNEENLATSSNIDEAVISELPENIRNKIFEVQKTKHTIAEKNDGDDATTSVRKINEKRPEKNVQTLQENFFKQTKPGVSRPAKVKMPPIHEIDMCVLIELPEDIRNEILNEYSAHSSGIQSSGSTDEGNNGTNRSTEVKNTAQLNRDEENISFSQVDPEFLAALSDDLKRDVQDYCTAKKAEQSARIKKDDATRKVGGGLLLRNENATVKGSKKTERKSKNNGKNSKISSKPNKRKGIATAFKTIQNKNEHVSEQKHNDVSKSILPRLSGVGSVNERVAGDEAEAILSHNRTISEDNESSIQHQDILIDLVNRLLNLPLEQVKMQIQIWITNSNIVNEVDFLSLATFLSMLPEKKRIEDLHILLKTMHRCMTKTGNCIWHRTYRKTVKYVQHYMQIEYNSNLMVPPIKCNHLQCNNDIM